MAPGLSSVWVLGLHPLELHDWDDWVELALIMDGPYLNRLVPSLMTMNLEVDLGRKNGL